MSKVKFRAWDNVGKCMLDWNMICQTAFNRSEEKTFGLMYRILTNQAQAGENYGFVVMLYTGLKDKNEKKIWEGDLISLSKYIYEVRFEDGKFVGYHVNNDYGKWGDLHRLFDSDFKDCDWKVIGNIHENETP